MKPYSCVQIVCIKQEYLIWLINWVGFYSISTIVGYSMPNFLYTSIKYVICKHILLIKFLAEPELFFHTVKCFQVMQYSNNKSISVIYLHTSEWINIYMICNWLVCRNFFLNELEKICLHSSIVIVSTQLNSFNHCYLTLIILFICSQTIKLLQE